MAFIQERTGRNGKKMFRVNIRVKGHPIICATFDRKTDATRWAQKTESDIRNGKHFPSATARRVTLKNLIDRYRVEILPQKKHGPQRSQAQHLLWWEEQIGEMTLDQITPAVIIQYRDQLAQGVTKKGTQREPATVVRYLTSLSHVFTVAMREWLLIDDTPFRKVSKPKEPRGIVRFLSDDERVRLLEECRRSTSKDLYAAVVLALSTGCRRGELLTLRWSQVDLKRGLLIFEETKNNERRNVPLTGHAHELLAERAKLRRIDSDFVFPGYVPGCPIDLTKPWRTAMERAQIKNFRWHDLRHSCASYLAMNGATPSEIAEVLGHKTLQMVKRYAHLSDAHTSKVVAAMNEKIFGKG